MLVFPRSNRRSLITQRRGGVEFAEVRDGAGRAYSAKHGCQQEQKNRD